jgi:hypothetical protein
LIEVKPKSAHRGGRKRSNKNNNHNNEVNKDDIDHNNDVHEETMTEIINEYSVIVHKNDDPYGSVENS